MILSSYSTSAPGWVLLTSPHLEDHFCFLFHSGEPWGLHWVTRLFPSPPNLDPNFLCKIYLLYNKIIAGCGFIWKDIILAWQIGLVGPRVSGEPFTRCSQTQGIHATPYADRADTGWTHRHSFAVLGGGFSIFPRGTERRAELPPWPLYVIAHFGKKRWQLIKIQALHH